MSQDVQELFTRYRGNPILTATDIPYPANSVFNAGAVKVGEESLLLLRVEDRRGLSHLTVARSKDGFTNWRIDPHPTLFADPVNHPEEIWGIEDPRICRMDGETRYIIAYTAYSKAGPLVSLATTEDFVFCCGAIPEDDGTLKIYWGGADTVVCAGTVRTDELVDLCLDDSRSPV